MAKRNTSSAAKHQCDLRQSSAKRDAAEATAEALRPHFPAGVARPALRALAAAGYRQLADLDGVERRSLAELHGMGPKALDAIDGELRAGGMQLA